MGSRKLYDWLHDHMAVEFRRGCWVNDPFVLRQNSKMVSINTCLMVDFTGQVASESIGPAQYSGTGGQADTAIGAREGYTARASRSSQRLHRQEGTVSNHRPVLRWARRHPPRADTDHDDTSTASLPARPHRPRSHPALIGPPTKFRES
jgi:acyl-CoA hydrolase